ncbi:hypothetical protein HMPREF1985_00164 [Mitsuokella sp. oral taxon 131 str. W9106]|nr:hypothetical protein HMPREF1985_00164 [Mitsuokella sp. oral taxon 131 str. W9106]
MGRNGTGCLPQGKAVFFHRESKRSEPMLEDKPNLADAVALAREEERIAKRGHARTKWRRASI